MVDPGIAIPFLKVEETGHGNYVMQMYKVVEKVGNLASTTYENKPLHGAWLGLCYDEMFTSTIIY